MRAHSLLVVVCGALLAGCSPRQPAATAPPPLPRPETPTRAAMLRDMALGMSYADALRATHAQTATSGTAEQPVVYVKAADGVLALVIRDRKLAELRDLGGLLNSVVTQRARQVRPGMPEMRMVSFMGPWTSMSGGPLGHSRDSFWVFQDASDTVTVSVHEGAVRFVSSTGRGLVASGRPPVSDGPRVEQPQAVDRHGVPVYLMPIGNFPAAEARLLADEVGRNAGVHIQVLQTRVLPANAVDAARRQVVAERLLPLVTSGARPVAPGIVTTVIGLTDADIYTEGESWRYCFGIVRGHRAVVSSARMDPGAFGERPDAILAHERLKKLLTKYVGMAHLGLSTSDDPKSVMYGHVMGPEDLDRMGDRL